MIHRLGYAGKVECGMSYYFEIGIEAQARGHGTCIELNATMAAQSVDFILFQQIGKTTLKLLLNKFFIFVWNYSWRIFKCSWSQTVCRIFE